MADPSNQQTNMIDPFDRVLLLKYIDNAILTSFSSRQSRKELQNEMITTTFVLLALFTGCYHCAGLDKCIAGDTVRKYENARLQIVCPRLDLNQNDSYNVTLS